MSDEAESETPAAEAVAEHPEAEPDSGQGGAADASDAPSTGNNSPGVGEPGVAGGDNGPGEGTYVPQRGSGRWGARLALSLAGSREVEQACHVVEPVLRSAPMIDSATIRKDLRKLNAALRRWDSNPQVRRIAPALTAVSTGQI